MLFLLGVAVVFESGRCINREWHGYAVLAGGGKERVEGFHV